MDKLKQSVKNFTALEKVITDGSHQLFHKVVASMHELCFSILDAEKKGKSRAYIDKIIKPARDIHSRSVFVNRLQEWPRKYPGDFETIEYLCDHENKSVYGTVEYYIEEYALNSAIAQQHRNKLSHQSGIILDTLLNNGNDQKILSVGCGGCRDILSIEKYIKNIQFELVINDIDSDALELSGKRLEHLKGLHVVPGNIIQALRRVEKLGPFDLIVTGGLFDHMSDKHAVFFLKYALSKLLKKDGTLFFANAVKGNPFRTWMEYLADWKLNYRTEDEITGLLTDAGFSDTKIKIDKGETGLTFLVEAKG
ncbi:MAG: class I SAM-dependent methyltransferase, partial [Thermodesulfovibrionia bacterium]|nr:class I SAM-dependent methyltransferase [Thermodesulfovibrionia bacterium]